MSLNKNTYSIATDSSLETPSPAALFSSSFWVSKNIWEGGVDVTIRAYFCLWGMKNCRNEEGDNALESSSTTKLVSFKFLGVRGYLGGRS